MLRTSLDLRKWLIKLIVIRYFLENLPETVYSMQLGGLR